MLQSLSRTVGRLVVDLHASHGATLVDASGRSYIDLNSHIASLVLGYNHPSLVVDPVLAKHRTATNIFPSREHEEHLKTVFPRISPMKEDNAFLYLGSTGSEAIEAAIKLCTRRASPSSVCLSFRGGFHGRTIGALSLTQTDPAYKRGFPTIPTVDTPFPCSPSSEDAAIEDFATVLSKQPVAGVFVEPVQSEGGDRFASDEFFRRLRTLCSERNVPFVVDEVQTAMGTGRLWAHQHWDLDSPPDMVVFSKKLQCSGVFAHPSFAPSADEAYAYNSTWAGDAHRSGLLANILDTIEEQDLYTQSSEVGQQLFDGIRTLPSVTNVRHRGAFGAFDVADRTGVIHRLQEHGVIVGPCGENSIRIRPPLNLTSDDVDLALERMSKSF